MSSASMSSTTVSELAKSFGFDTPVPEEVFLQLRQVALGSAALAQSSKELIALAICICTHRENVEDHVRAAAAAGACREEILETIGEAILMGGRSALDLGYAAAGACAD